MRNWVAAAVAVAVFVPALIASDTFEPKDGKFAVKFPGKPKEIIQTAKTAVGELKLYTDFPAGSIKPDNHVTLYAGIKEGLKGSGGKVISEHEITIGDDKLTGQEIVIDKGKQQTRFRVVVHGNRLFQIATLGSGAFVMGKDATAFLESFDFSK